METGIWLPPVRKCVLAFKRLNEREIHRRRKDNIIHNNNNNNKLYMTICTKLKRVKRTKFLSVGRVCVWS